MTGEQARGIVKLVMASWPAQRMRMTAEDASAMTVSYADGLSDLAEAQTRAAINRLKKTHEWFPTIAAIRKAVGVVAAGRQKSPMEAWDEVHAAQMRHGSHKTPGVEFHFADAITANIVRAIGWLEICRSTTPDHIRARFLDAYQSLAADARAEMAASVGANQAPAMRIPMSHRIEEPRAAGQLVASLLPTASPSPDEINDAPCEHEGRACPERCRCTCDVCWQRIARMARKLGGELDE